MTFIGNLHASVLAVFPFFGIFLYYHNYSLVIFLHASFLFLLVLLRELSKDLLTYRGDIIYNYQTIPVRYNLYTAKIVISFVSFLILIPGLLIVLYGNIGLMQLYFYVTFGVLVMLVHGMWNIKGVKWYNLQYNVVKFLIVLGVFSIALIPYKLVF
jgi:4-hydroxybenzoate polyprenyltransferase